MSGRTTRRLRAGAWLAAVFLAAGLSGCGPETTGTGSEVAEPTVVNPTVVDPWIRAAPPTARVLAGYLVLANPGAQAVTLVGATSPVAAMVEIHETVVRDGVASMERRPELVVPAGGQLVLEPGGAHLMFMQPSAVPVAGETVPVTLSLGDGSTLEAVFAVRDGAAGSGHEHHHPEPGPD